MKIMGSETVHSHWWRIEEIAARGGVGALDLEQFRPAVEALERQGRRSYHKDGALHWEMTADYYTAQRLIAVLDATTAMKP